MDLVQELKEFIRDCTAVERNMIDDYIKGKKLVEVKDAPFGYRWK